MNNEPISDLAAQLYVDADMMTVAETLVGNLFETRDHVMRREVDGLVRLPGWRDLSSGAAARKVLAALLEAGWTPPSEQAVSAAVKRVTR